MRCGVLLLQLRHIPVFLGRDPPKRATFVLCISSNSPRAYNIIWRLALCKCRSNAFVPLWVYGRHFLPSQRRRQHDVLALAAAPGVAAARVPAATAGVVAAR